MKYKITFLRVKGGTNGSDFFEAGSEGEAVEHFQQRYEGSNLILTGVKPVEKAGEKADPLPNITIYDNGAGFCIQVNGLMVHHFRALGDAWRHIEWMHKVASQKFTVGKEKIPVETWIEGMTMAGMLE